jgi:chain length determinant protein tyrosine kinase EpsG
MNMETNLQQGVTKLGGIKPGKNIGYLLLESGKITEQDAERVLRLQKDEKLRFGDAAIKLGLIKEEDIQLVLAQQFDYPYLLPDTGGFDPRLAAAYEPFSAQVESLRALRSQLMLRWFDSDRRALTIVGTDARDGADLLAANLAIVCSQLGERTLLVDADLRAGRLHELFNKSASTGLSDILANRADLSAIMRIPNFVDLSLLPSGTVAPNPAELLSRPLFKELVTSLSGHFDIVLYNTPSAKVAVDYQAVAQHTRGAITVVRKHKARLNEVSQVKTMLDAAGVSIVGAVINDL